MTPFWYLNSFVCFYIYIYVWSLKRILTRNPLNAEFSIVSWIKVHQIFQFLAMIQPGRPVPVGIILFLYSRCQCLSSAIILWATDTQRVYNNLAKYRKKHLSPQNPFVKIKRCDKDHLCWRSMFQPDVHLLKAWKRLLEVGVVTAILLYN